MTVSILTTLSSRIASSFLQRYSSKTHDSCFHNSCCCIYHIGLHAMHNAPKAKRKGYRQNESPMIKTKAEQSFCYAPTGKSGCIFSIRFSWILLPWEWRRKKHACITHIPGCICHFALGFCKYIKKRTETLYQSFSPLWSG